MGVDEEPVPPLSHINPGLGWPDLPGYDYPDPEPDPIVIGQV